MYGISAISVKDALKNVYGSFDLLKKTDGKSGPIGKAIILYMSEEELKEFIEKNSSKKHQVIINIDFSYKKT
jgi:hypothetical protein